MKFNWENYLELSIDLCKQDTDAAIRSSISRAYYASFCYSRDIIKTNKLATESQINDLFKRDAKVHEELRRILTVNNYNNPEIASNIVNFLNNTRIMRNRADYNSKYNSYDLEKDSKLAIKRSKYVLDNIHKLKKK